MEKRVVWLYPTVKNVDDTITRSDRIHEGDRRTHRRPMTAQSALAWHRAAKTCPLTLTRCGVNSHIVGKLLVGGRQPAVGYYFTCFCLFLQPLQFQLQGDDYGPKGSVGARERHELPKRK